MDLTEFEWRLRVGFKCEGWDTVFVVPSESPWLDGANRVDTSRHDDHWYEHLTQYYIASDLPYCTIRRASSLAVCPSPIGTLIRYTWQEDAERIEKAFGGPHSYGFTPTDPERLVAVMDQGDRAVAVVYELFELPAFVVGLVALSVRRENNELARFYVGTEMFKSSLRF